MTVSAQLFVGVCVVFAVLNVMLMATAYLILLERKVASWAQDRIGPNRTGFGFGQDNLWRSLGLDFMNRFRFLGLGQALADGAKLLFKEDYTPPRVDKMLFLLAPALIMIPAMIGMAVIPWGGEIHVPSFSLMLGSFQLLAVEGGTATVAVAPLSIGVIYLLGTGSLGVYGVTIGAYASNNKYAFLGGLRATAQMLSYEIPMGLAVLIMILLAGSPDVMQMVNWQSGSGWGILAHPMVAVVFFVCILAECNRSPFDLAECEQELVGGFHTEYTSMKWAMFFLGEYMHMITGSAFFVVLFLGGWELLPFTSWLSADATGWSGLLLVLARFGVMAAKVGLLIFLMMWIRWTLPRFRFDQLMRLAWQGLIPLMILMLLASSLLVYLGHNNWWCHGLADVICAAVAMQIAPRISKGLPINRKIPLEGSRFSPNSSVQTGR